MEFDSIGDFFGVAQHSQNNKFLLIIRNKTSNTPCDIIVADKESKKPIYAYRLKYTTSATIANNGAFAAISYDHDTLESTITCLNNEGMLSFKKISQANPLCLAFDNNSEYLVVSFTGEDINVECYAIVWFDVKTGFLIKAEQAPDIATVFEMHFNNDNKLILKTS